MAETHKTILIAEDSPDDVFIIRRSLAKTGLPYQLRFVSDGEQAIDYLQRKPPYDNTDTFPRPSLLILDLNMPHANGFEVLEWLKSQSVLQRLPIVIHSSSNLESDQHRSSQLGAIAYFVKSGSPSDVGVMFKTIAANWLQLSIPP